jgi:universal stress protein E
MNLEKILVIADRDDPRQKALRAALDLARGTRAVISVVGFLFDDMVEHPELIPATTARQMKAAMIRDKKAWLHAAIEGIEPGEARIRQTVVWTRDISGWVAEHAGEFGLVIKCANRSEGLIHTPLDWQLLRESKVPVMIVRDRLRKRPGRILACVDLGSSKPAQRDLNRRVLAGGHMLARQLGAELHVVYAIPLSALAQDLALVDRALMERKATRALEAELAAISEEFDVPRKNIVIKAGPPERILDGQASKLKATLLVMGTLGRKGLKGKLLGNTAEKVLHLNRSTVLALRPV